MQSRLGVRCRTDRLLNRVSRAPVPTPKKLTPVPTTKVNMLKVRNLLVALLCASPLLILWDGRITHGLVTGIIAIALGQVALALRPAESRFLVSVTRQALIAAAVPALWVLVQVLPLGIFAHPIWKSAASALHEPIFGSISIDPAITIAALGYYLSLVAVGFVSASVAVDRHRAEWVLTALTTAVTITSLMVLAAHFFALGNRFPAFDWSDAIDCVSLGTIVAATNCILVIERHEARSPRERKLANLWIFPASIAALIICAAAFALTANWSVVFATGYGLLALAWQWITRRLGWGLWAGTAMAIAALGVAAILVGSQLPQRKATLPLAFAGDSSPPLIELNQRILYDAPLVGTGAGTFGALTPIYRQKDDPDSAPVPATTAAAFAVELGTPLLWVIFAEAVVFVVVLFRRSLRRGRDSFYSAMAASSLVMLVVLAFSNAGLLRTGTGLIVAAILGLGIAQSESRTIHA